MESFINITCLVRKRNLLAHLIIWAIASTVLIISSTVFKDNLFGTGYLIFFISFVILFQSSYKLWARSIKVYCIILIMYSTGISLLTYSFQYAAIASWYKMLLSEQALKDIGLVTRDTVSLFLEPFASITLTMFLFVYLRIFHYDFNRFAYLAEEGDMSLMTPLTASQAVINRTINNSTLITLNANNVETQETSQITGQAEQTSRLASPSDSLPKNAIIEALINFINATSESCLRVLEIHFVKLVVFVIFMIPIFDVCLINIPLLVVSILAVRYPSSARGYCLVASWLISGIIIIRNLSTFPTTGLDSLKTKHHCINNTNFDDTTGSTYFDYIGLESNANAFLNIIVLLIITVFSFICIHSEKRSSKDYEVSLGVIFSGIGRREADSGVLNAIKYFCNFGFHEFGIEITCLALVIAISYRLDVVGALYGVILILCSIVTSRNKLAYMWPVISLLVCIIIPLEYILRLGLPLPLCQKYPWDDKLSEDLKIWLFLSDYKTGPNVNLLLYDFLVLLFICRQSIVFKHESMSLNSSSGQVYNNFSAHQFRLRYIPNLDEFATEDCFTNYSTQSNFLKSIFFKSIYWITLAVVLVSGATKISSFSLGYLFGCFWFLWLGNDAYLIPTKKLIISWNCLILYASSVIFLKVILQLYTCMNYEDYHQESNIRYQQLLGVTCYRKEDASKLIPYDKIDILWDGLCLMFLLMQRIVFGSHYFKFLVKEVKAQQILASRGAELIMATQLEEAKAQALNEKEVMRSIRAKMVNLKSDSQASVERSLALPHHHQIIRSADRHLFSPTNDEPVSQCKRDDWRFRKAFIPDPLGDELERMGKINGISAVYGRWMKCLPLYGVVSSAARDLPPAFESPLSTSPRNEFSEDSDAQQQAVGSEQEVQIDPEIQFDQLGRACFEGKDDDCSSTENYRLRAWWDLLYLISYSCLLSATIELNKLSRSYRYVSRRMTIEKNILKKQFNLDDERFKRDSSWRRGVISTLSEMYTRTSEQNQANQSNTSLHRIRSALRMITNSSVDPGTSGNERSPPVESEKSSTVGTPNQRNRAELTDPEYHFLKLNIFTQFCRALAYVFISNTSLLCHLIIIFNQVSTASLLSLPLPLMTFLWGTLSVPRATKRFWITVITYTEVVIGIKYVSRFSLWNSLLWDTSSKNPFDLPHLLGISNVTSSIIIYDLILLLVLFLHRSMLKSLGQWDATDNKESISGTNNLVEQGTSTPTIREDSVHFGPKKRRNSIGELRRVKSVELQENIDRSIELSSRIVKSVELEQTQAYNDYIQESYQNPNTRSNDIKENTQSPKSRSLFGRAFNRIKISVTSFFEHVLNNPYKVQTDVYTWMFLCDFVNFLILIYGFWAFGEGYGNQTLAYFLEENRIPTSVLVMLLLQFASIIIDRSLYLLKNIGRKLVFQVALVLMIHFWLFFLLPFNTRHAELYTPPKVWYVIKCIYFLLSAHQIRSGYPRRVLGNCFTKNFNRANLYAFKAYRAIPLVYDLRHYMDWIWTKTTLEFRDWSIMEDIFANLFIRKCELTLEEEYPTLRAKPIRRLSKYLTGGAFILLILCIIWGPLLIFSLGKTVGESNLPVEMEYTLEFAGFQPILKMRATGSQITTINATQFDLLRSNFTVPSYRSFLDEYKVGDVAAIKMDDQYNAVWEISPPSRGLLLDRLKSSEPLSLKSSWTLSRVKKKKSQNFDVKISGTYERQLNTISSDPFRVDLYEMITNAINNKTSTTDRSFAITPPIFPNYIRIPETGNVSLVDQFYDNSSSVIPPPKLRPLKLSFTVENFNSWWKAEDLCTQNRNEDVFSYWYDTFPHCDSGSLLVVAFNDRIFTGILAFLTASGIIGIYTTFVVFFARLIRSEPAAKVIYSEIPNVDRIYGLIMDIYMMRECKEFELEEKLFAKLLFLYRSPELIIDWSRRDNNARTYQISHNQE